MNRGRAIAGLCMLCALLISAFAAQGASAATKGTTAFTCKEVAAGTGHFKKAHCKPEDAGTGNFDHVAFAEKTTTDLSITSEKTNAETNATTPSTLKATVAGTAIELTTNTVHGEGGLENLKEGPTEPNPGEHYIHAHKVTLTYTNVEEKKAGCEVFTDKGPTEPVGEKGVIHTEPLTVTSTGQGDSLKITPETGTTFAVFWLKNCVVEGTYKVVGSLTCKPDGATIKCDHTEVTTQGNLHLQSAVGPKAGYEGSLTISGKDTTPGDVNFTPLSVTTVETP
jgi:hypothetical protein